MTARKYRNEPVEVGGHRFDSKKEARRYGELQILERAGKITALTLQPKYPLHVNDTLICTYFADFRYVEQSSGKWIVEDVKSPATRKQPVYRIKAKLLKALHGIDVREV